MNIYSEIVPSCDYTPVENEKGTVGFAGSELISHLPSRLQCLSCGLNLAEPKSSEAIIHMEKFALELYGVDSVEELPPIQVGLFNTDLG